MTPPPQLNDVQLPSILGNGCSPRVPTILPKPASMGLGSRATSPLGGYPPSMPDHHQHHHQQQHQLPPLPPRVVAGQHALVAPPRLQPASSLGIDALPRPRRPQPPARRLRRASRQILGRGCRRVRRCLAHHTRESLEERPLLQPSWLRTSRQPQGGGEDEPGPRDGLARQD
ncbi:hypothetical protein NLG97_g11065 [Lecanicillium saksenae]|uniref:Uncharacterized protein n=1 Tax=Lecanicillium saksenae TaxID=468837 RepID=A0ACC1QBG0_9HYPO|nr:hypothetical protein NLG97_g11065 [Lecanicillium saksenae]